MTEGKMTIDAIWIAGTLFGALGMGVAYFLVRMDHAIERLENKLNEVEEAIGSLKNADVSCTREQDLLRLDMRHIRHTLLKIVGYSAVRKFLSTTSLGRDPSDDNPDDRLVG